MSNIYRSNLVYRISLAVVFACLILPNVSLGQGVDLELVNFFEDFSSQQGANGITMAVLPSESDDSPLPLVYNAVNVLGNGTQTFEGPGFITPGGIIVPYVQQELSREFLALHPNQTNGVSVQYKIEATGCVRVSADFARANDSLNTGDGVNVGIFLNDLDTPVFEASISSAHEVDATIGGDVFAGTGSVSFDQTITVQEDDILLFVVFAGNSSDAGFDVTAFRGSVSAVPELVNFFEDFSSQQGVNGITMAVLPSESDDSPLPLVYNAVNVLGNGTQTFEGPGFITPGGIIVPYVQQELSREFLALHPNQTNGVSVQYKIEATGCVRVSADFARANDSLNTGDGVNVGIFLNDLDTPIFEASISSAHEVDATIGGDVFAGTGSVSFDQPITVQEDDILLFVVFAGNSSDAGFDVTAFRGSVSAAPQIILGDVNQDDVVNFLDISPFIGILSSGAFLAEADIDQNEVVNFLDISPFIGILSGN